MPSSYKAISLTPDIAAAFRSITICDDLEHSLNRSQGVSEPCDETKVIVVHLPTGQWIIAHSADRRDRSPKSFQSYSPRDNSSSPVDMKKLVGDDRKLRQEELRKLKVRRVHCCDCRM